MKYLNTFCSTILFFLIGIVALSAQDSKSLAFDEAMIWQERLFLSQDQATKLEKTLLQFNENYKKLMVDVYSEEKGFQTRYDKLIENRNRSIKGIVGQQSFFVFSRMEKNRINSAKAFFDTFLSILTEDENLGAELTAFHSHSVLPVLNKYRYDFQDEMNSEDSLKLVMSSVDFRDALKSFSGNGVYVENAKDFNKLLKEIGKDKPGNKKIVKGIKKLSKVYKEELNESMVALDPFLTSWKKDLVDIFSKYLSSEEVKNGTRLLGALGAYGVTKKVNRTSFLLYDPGDEASYFDLKLMLYSVFFKQLLN